MVLLTFLTVSFELKIFLSNQAKFGTKIPMSYVVCILYLFQFSFLDDCLIGGLGDYPKLVLLMVKESNYLHPA